MTAGGRRHLLAGRGQRRTVGRGEPVGDRHAAAGVTFVSATGTGWACTNSGERLGHLHPADAGDRRDRADDHRRRHGPGPGGPLTNTRDGVSATTPDPNLANNTSSAITTVTASADLSIVKTGPATVTAAGSVTYSLVVANAGPSDAATSR